MIGNKSLVLLFGLSALTLITFYQMGKSETRLGAKPEDVRDCKEGAQYIL
jgi:hypothetical protein